MTQFLIKTLAFLLFFFLIFDMAQAQDDAGRIYRSYQTQKMQLTEEQTDPLLREGRSEIESFIRTFESSGKTLSKGNIPIVFHIMQSDGETVVTQEMIMAQLAVINMDFNRDAQNQEFKHEADWRRGYDRFVSQLELQFYLPEVDDDGKEVAPISVLEYNIEDAVGINDVKSSEKEGVDAIDPEHIINVWIVDLPDDKAGFAQMPGGAVETDGIVINAKYIAGQDQKEEVRYYGGGKTLTHLIGSYLGLLELWGENERCRDDGVADTPIANAPNYSLVQYKHLSTCDGYPIEMVMNYMDNTDDVHLTMFTEGQKTRILTMLSEGGPRAGLLNQ